MLRPKMPPDRTMKYAFLLLVLVACSQSVPDHSHGRIHQAVKVCADWTCKSNYDIGVMVPDHERRLKAIEHELTGVETGCVLEKYIYDVGEYRPTDTRLGEIYVKTICIGDTKTVDAYGDKKEVDVYREKNCFVDATICVKDDPESCVTRKVPDYCD